MLRSLPFLVAHFLTVGMTIATDAIATAYHATDAAPPPLTLAAYSPRRQTTSRRGSGRREMLGMVEGAIVEIYE